MGAAIGALYASGLSGKQIREHVGHAIIPKAKLGHPAAKKLILPLKWLSFFDPSFGHPGLLKGDKFMAFLFKAMGVSTFGKLKIPLRVVATDFWDSKEVVLERGDLLQALKASMGVPGIFSPVLVGGRILVDGGAVNPLPYDHLADCDVVVAIDVTGRLGDNPKKLPGSLQSVLGTFDTMQNTIITQRIRMKPPDLYIKPDIVGVDILGFDKSDEIFAAAAHARGKLARFLRRLSA
jgi:NTE family protein